MPWAKGQSGNPKGSPRRVPKHVVELAREHTEEAIKTLKECLNSESDRTRVAAAEALLSRAWGQPRAELDVTHHNLPVATTDDAALLALAIAGGCVASSAKADQGESGGVVH